MLEIGPLQPSAWFPDGFQCAYGCLNRATHVVLERGQRWPVCAEHAGEGG